jgi:D-amino-acid dehydrogenase
MKVAIVGAGVVGVTTAYELMMGGHEVVLMDRGADVGLECSHANGGFVALSQAVPWSAPGVPAKTLLGMFAKDPPILLHMTQLPAMWRWGLEFLACSRQAPSLENTRHVLRLALYSHAVLKQTRSREAIDYAPVAKGCLKVFREQSSLDHAAVASQAQTALGLNYSLFSPAECVAMVPALAPRAADLAGGVFYGDEECGDCFGFTRELARICASRGAKLLFETTVELFDHDGERIAAAITNKGRITADAFVLAAGAASPLIARSFGVRLPIIPVKGYSLTFARDLWPQAPDMPVLDEKRKFGYAPLGADRLRMTGFAEISGYDTVPEAKRTRAFAQAFIGLFPQLEERISIPDLKPFCCLRPVTPSGLPVLGHSRMRNLHYNVGHGHLGWTLAHGSARIVAATIAGRRPDIDVTGYGPSPNQ